MGAIADAAARLLRLAAFASVVGGGGALAADPRDIAVNVQVEDGEVRVVSSFFVEAPSDDVWAVMTDFEAMPRFVANIKSSAVVSRAGNLVTVAQSGRASYGPVSYEFQSVRELRLTPERLIESRMISGNMKRYNGTTALVPEGGGTRVTVRSLSVPERWVPPIVGPRFIEHETREQLGEFRAEILRRKGTRKQ